MLDSYQTYAWTAFMLEQIQRGMYAEIHLVIVNNSPGQDPTRSGWERLRWRLRKLPRLAVGLIAERVYRMVMERSRHLPDANFLVDIRNVLLDVPEMKVDPVKRGLCDYFKPADIATIKRYDLDVLYRDGFGILRGDILKASRYGVWSLHHGDNRVHRGGPAGFWETMENWPETGSTLQHLTEGLDNGVVLYRSFSCTERGSVIENRSNYYWKTSYFLPRALKQLQELGEEEFFTRVAACNSHPQFYSRRLYKRPTNNELIRLTIRKTSEKLARRLRSMLEFEKWILMYHLSDVDALSLWRYKPLFPPKGHFWADPHVIAHEGQYYIFIEDFSYTRKKGVISLIIMDENGNYGQPEVLIDRDYHLSYPHVFEYQGDLYMVPESASNHTIELYKCIQFPRIWELQRNLMENVCAYDSTLFPYQGRWWLFANMTCIPGVSAWDELFLFSTDDPIRGEWVPHPQNPVVSDCKNARPAGRLFMVNGKIYRPAQNCSRKYGYGFNINQVTRLDKKGFEESVVSQIAPEWNKRVTGTHTYSCAGRLHVIDSLYRRGRILPWPARL